MIPSFRLFPDTASSVAGEVNTLYILMIVFTGGISLAIAAFLVYSAIRYHRKNENEMGAQFRNNYWVEATWTILPFFFFMAMFAWGAKLYFDIERPPDNAIRMYVVGKQWMWKIQHPEGQREIDALHIPVGRPVELIMTSEDAIHSFYVPAFRTKQDVLPGRYTTTWFEATKPGRYHLFCAEFCGAKHSGMIGYVYAMEPREYQAWLTQGVSEGSLASMGEKYFHQYGCSNCHHFDNAGRAPHLTELYNRPVQLSDGQTITADDNYIHQSILNPGAKIVYGYANIMPNFTGVLSEEQVIALISYIKALSPPPGSREPSSSGTTPKIYGAEKGIGGPGATADSTSQKGVR